MGADDDSNNPFVRFRHHVDSTVQRGVQSVFGSSSTSASIASSNEQPTRPDIPAQSLDRPIPDPRAMVPTPRAQEPMPSSPPAGNESTSAEDVYAWAISSPYSPLNLQHLPQPVPRDVRDAPADLAGAFTFRDAFDDLLITSAGQPLPSIQSHALTKRVESMVFAPDGLHVEDWVTALAWTRGKGVWGAYFPALSPLARRHLMMPARGLSGPDTTGMTFRPPPMSRGLGLGLEMPRESLPSWQDWQDRDPVEAFGGLFKAAVSAAREIAAEEDKSGYNEDREADAEEDFQASTKSAPAVAAPWSTWPWPGTQNRYSDDEADSEEELYTSANSQFAKSRPSWQAMSQRDSRDSTASAAPEEESTNVVMMPSGGKIVYTCKKSNRDGKSEVTTLRQEYDADGNLVSQGEDTTTKRTWSAKASGAEASLSWSFRRDTSNTNTSGFDEQEVGNPEAERRKKDGWSGWFWTR